MLWFLPNVSLTVFSSNFDIRQTLYLSGQQVQESWYIQIILAATPMLYNYLHSNSPQTTQDSTIHNLRRTGRQAYKAETCVMFHQIQNTDSFWLYSLYFKTESRWCQAQKMNTWWIKFYPLKSTDDLLQYKIYTSKIVSYLAKS